MYSVLTCNLGLLPPSTTQVPRKWVRPGADGFLGGIFPLPLSEKFIHLLNYCVHSTQNRNKIVPSS